MSLECTLLIATSVGLRCVFVPNVACVFGMSIIDCHLGWSSLCIVYIVPNVACVFGMSIIDCHLGWSSLCILCQMLPVSLECPLLIATSVGLRCV